MQFANTVTPSPETVSTALAILQLVSIIKDPTEFQIILTDFKDQLDVIAAKQLKVDYSASETSSLSQRNRFLEEKLANETRVLEEKQAAFAKDVAAFNAVKAKFDLQMAGVRDYVKTAS